MTRPISLRRRITRLLFLSIQILASHPLRTGLSTSGLLVGVAAVMVMVAVTEGAERRIVSRVQALGTNVLIVTSTTAQRVAGRTQQSGTHTLLRAADAEAIARESEWAVAAAPAVIRPVVVRSEGRNSNTTALGTTPSGLAARNIRAASGRVFDEDDEREQRRIALLGATVAENLFGARNPVGSEVRIASTPFEVIGVLRPRGSDPGGTDLDNMIVMPLSAAMRRVFNVPYIDAIFVQAAGAERLDALEKDVRAILEQRHPTRVGTALPYTIQQQAVLLRTQREGSRAMQRLTITVATLALAVGGVGILAVMLMSVKERTHEIGLRRAVGARKQDIVIQFLMESTILAAVAGVGGVIAGLLVAALAARLGRWELVWSWSAAAAGIIGSTLLGIASGVLPARRAAKMEPGVALHA